MHAYFSLPTPYLHTNHIQIPTYLPTYSTLEQPYHNPPIPILPNLTPLPPEAHAVDAELVRVSARRHHLPPGAHAEAIHPPLAFIIPLPAACRGVCRARRWLGGNGVTCGARGRADGGS
jgi:hypothetical protein